VNTGLSHYQLQGSHQDTKLKFPDITGRFLKIADGASSIYH